MTDKMIVSEKELSFRNFRVTEFKTCKVKPRFSQVTVQSSHCSVKILPVQKSENYFSWQARHLAMLDRVSLFRGKRNIW